MISKQASSKRIFSHGEESETRKRSKPSLDIADWKDEIQFKSPASPAATQLKTDNHGRKPAEVFRTDFITAMKVTDNVNFSAGKNYELTDPWRQEWEKGVQVPVNPDALPKTSLRKKENPQQEKRYSAFSLPKARITHENPELVHSSEKTTVCLYDLDDSDVEWLKTVNGTVKRGSSIDESAMEKAITYFERKCFENMAHAVATKKGLSIEYDDTTICDVCLSPDTEDSNEIVFCDACNMCVHQACYGVQDIPTGTWLCRPCSRGVLSPHCIICPNKGGAMKRVKNSFEWIHVICAWWVPEVKIEDTDNVEKMTVDKIPASRKNLCCSLCREKVGACIQCSVKRCVVAYHVTCAVKEGLEMKTVMMHEKDDVQHISYCKRHCIPQPQENVKPRAGDEVENQRLKELQKLQDKFYGLVDLRSSARELRLGRDMTQKLLSYWILKRQANHSRPLMPLTTEQQEKLSGKQGIYLIQEQINVEMERYGLLRQDLERLRNLCYLIIRRERGKREVHKASQEIFYKQETILSTEGESMSDEEFRRMSSGNTLMRFTKFTHYAPDGPPYADHAEAPHDEEDVVENDENSNSETTATDAGEKGEITEELNSSEPKESICIEKYQFESGKIEVSTHLDLPPCATDANSSTASDTNSPVAVVTEQQRKSSVEEKIETGYSFQSKSDTENTIEKSVHGKETVMAETIDKNVINLDTSIEAVSAESSSQCKSLSPSRKPRQRRNLSHSPSRVLRSSRGSVVNGKGSSRCVAKNQIECETELADIRSEPTGLSGPNKESVSCASHRPITEHSKKSEAGISRLAEVSEKDDSLVDSRLKKTETAALCQQIRLFSEVTGDLNRDKTSGNNFNENQMGECDGCNFGTRGDNASTVHGRSNYTITRSSTPFTPNTDDIVNKLQRSGARVLSPSSKILPKDDLELLRHNDRPSDFHNDFKKDNSISLFHKGAKRSSISSELNGISDLNEPKKPLVNGLGNGASRLGAILCNNLKSPDENSMEDKPLNSLHCKDILANKKTNDRIFKLNEINQMNCIDDFALLKSCPIENCLQDHKPPRPKLNFIAENQEMDRDADTEDKMVNGKAGSLKLGQSLKNPVVVLSEIPNIAFYKKVSPCTLNGMSESPKKTRRYSDLPSPAFPRTVIDDLVACPQRLTRGRTQLMMSGDEGRKSRKAPKRRRKSMFELGTGRDMVLELSSSDTESPISPQRLTRRRLRWLGSGGSKTNEMEVIDELDCSRDDFHINVNKKASASDPNRDGHIGQAAKRIHVDEITGSPTRLTRARVRSLGLDQGFEI